MWMCHAGNVPGKEGYVSRIPDGIVHKVLTCKLLIFQVGGIR
jgi:hypothetical protein